MLLGVVKLLSAQSTGQSDILFTLPEITVLDIEPDASAISLSLDTPTEAGAPATISSGGTDNSKWLNYTCSLNPSSTTRTVWVEISSGTLPLGLELNVSAGTSNSGAGTRGTPVGQVLLGNSSQALISGVGACYTGTGSGNGHQLTYTLSITDYSKLDNDANSTIEVTFTITD